MIYFDNSSTTKPYKEGDHIFVHSMFPYMNDKNTSKPLIFGEHMKNPYTYSSCSVSAITELSTSLFTTFDAILLIILY